MIYKVISLERTPERLAEFGKNNPEFCFEVFNAIDGILVPKTELFSDAVWDRYTPGAVGVAMSHRALWQQCVNLNEPMTIIEDDAYLISNFTECVNTITSTAGWDFIFWGCNLDQGIGVEFIPNIVESRTVINNDQLVANIHNFKHMKYMPAMYRCTFAIGLVCYSITPECARSLLVAVFPLKDYAKPYLNFGIDHAVLEEIPNMTTAIAMPPIVITKNDQSMSTVQKR